jgi:hypothetical protein
VTRIFNTRPDTFTRALVREIAIGEVLAASGCDVVRVAMLNAGFDEWPSASMRDYARAYRHGWGKVVTTNVERLSGHPARTIGQFVAEELDSSLV